SERWTATMNVFDLMLGKPFHVSRYFVFNPNFGLRAAWIDQDLLARYSWNSSQYVSSPTNLVEMFGENEYWGVGLRGGFKAEFILGGGWDLFGAFNISMLFSKFELDQDTSGFSSRAAGDYEFHNNYFTNVPNFDLTAGICYGHFFSKNKYMMSFKLAYEFQEWFQQNHFRRNYSDANITYNDEVPHGDLTLNGLSFRLQFDL
ncbi:MAG: hypothetical protein HZB76_06620, partial [Chlamydiae bacterium]|nr:hypothetical protein [Chlamydiota bacterium]